MIDRSIIILLTILTKAPSRLLAFHAPPVGLKPQTTRAETLREAPVQDDANPVRCGCIHKGRGALRRQRAVAQAHSTARMSLLPRDARRPNELAELALCPLPNNPPILPAPAPLVFNLGPFTYLPS